jgi:hypothetical protein
MIEQKLSAYFAKYHRINPDADFASRSLSKITATAQESVSMHGSWMLRLKETMTTSSALALASFLLLIVLGSVSYVAKQSGQMASLNKGAFTDDALAREAAQLSFQVELQAAEYFDESASQVVRALDRLSRDGM